MNNQKRKICFIEPKFLKSIGGVETHGYEFVKFFLKDKDYKIDSIISCKKVKDGIDLKIREKEFEKKTKRVLQGSAKKDAISILKNSSPDTEIYFFNNPNWILTSETIKNKKPTSKIFVRSGGNDIPAGWIFNEKNKKINLKENQIKIVETINKNVDKIIVNSKFSKIRMLDLGIKKEKIIIVSGGVDCKLFKNKKKKKDKKIHIYFWGRLVEFKGLKYSLMTIKKVYEKEKNIEFVIIGDGPEKENILKIINQLNLNKIIKYKGAMEFNKIPQEAKDADIFLHLPIYLKRHIGGGSYIHTETMGRTYCEASSLGIPCVVSNVGGSPEMIKDKITGFIVQEKDYFEASKKVLRLINNKKIRNKMSLSARELATKKYNWPHLITKYKKILEK